MQKAKRNYKSRIVQFTVLVVSILFIGIGVMKQEHFEVLQKAVRICLECIGIG